LLDRRLRIVERMRYNVAANDLMMRDNRTHFSFAGPTSGWRDGLRVHLFEYQGFKSSEIEKIPGLPAGSWVFFPGGATYAKVQSVTRNATDGTVISGSPANAWRFPAVIMANWQVSVGKISFYRIDLLSTPTDPVAVIDELFDYRGTLGSEPKKADIWNRAWLLCDQVISALQIEALLFGLRRRTTDAAAADTFRQLIAKRPPVKVTLDEGVKTIDTAFVSLDAHVRNVAEGEPADPKVLMRSDEAAGTEFADPYFTSATSTFGELQVGDQVEFLNSPVYNALTGNQGIWGLENAVVMELEPAADFSADRLAWIYPRPAFKGTGPTSSPTMACAKRSRARRSRSWTWSTCASGAPSRATKGPSCTGRPSCRSSGGALTTIFRRSRSASFRW
jgi:hypothetical protein